MRQPPNARRLAFALATVATLSIAACGDDDDASNAVDDTAADGPDPVEVTLVDYAFEDLPDTVDAGTTFTIVNSSEAELHEFVAFRLPDGETRSLEELTALRPDALVAALGEPATVLLAAPGGPMIEAVGDGTLTEPGRYAVMCFIPTGADPDEYLAAAAETEEGPPQGVAGGPPHFVNGMAAELAVR